MGRRVPLTCSVAAALFAWGPTAPAAEPVSQPTPDAFAAQVRPLLTQYCLKCHSGEKPKGELKLDGYADTPAVVKDRPVWIKVQERVLAHEMPPEGKPQPTAAESAALAAWLKATLGQQDCSGPRDPGRVTLRRLNRVEYNHTIRDLVGVDFRPGNDFPSDDVGYGFDNIGDVLSLPPILLEKYLAAAQRVVDAAIRSEPAHRRLIPRDPIPQTQDALAREVLERFATRAYRRPAAAAEVDRLVKLYRTALDEGDRFEDGIKLAVQAVLVSPHFLFRVEQDPPPGDPRAVRTLDEFELATRLSYFLWSSMPDEELFELARADKLRESGRLAQQVRRMIADARSQALVENFAGQWLQLRNLDAFVPARRMFRGFDNRLRAAMRTETEMFFAGVMREDRSVLEFLDARYTYVNAQLARHYDLPGVEGDQFRRVELPDDRRGGVITQASVLTVTSNPTRTSPVKRGKWILENILGAPPPDPPPDVPAFDERPESALTGSLRQRMEQHRAKADCAVCHDKMDALGFGLENFNAVGAWRTKDGKFDIDSSGELPGGEKFSGPGQLRAILAGKKDQFVRCLAEKMLTYALGRGMEYYDRCTVDDLAQAVEQGDYRFSSLVLAIVECDAFQKRRGPGASP